MLKIRLLERKLLSLVVILVMLLPSLLTVLLQPHPADAAQLTQRKITIATSKVSATGVVYSVSFKINTAITLKGIVVDFCSNSPLVAQSCTAPAGFNLNTGSTSIVNQKINGSAVGHAYTINGASSSSTLILTNATGNAVVNADTVTFDIGSGSGNGVTNPSFTGSYYARLLTYASDTDAAGYVSATPDIVGPHTDDGGVALSTANQLTTTARIQETLQFCVGTTDRIDNSLITTDCTTGNFHGNCGTVVDLGVLDSTVVSISPVPVSTASLPGGGNNCNGAAMVRTNASNGVVITYFAEQETSSGKLKVIGATCSGSSNTDQCFNDPGGATHQTPFTAGTEDFGVTVEGINSAGTSAYACSYTANPNTCKLEPSTDYLGQGTAGASEAYGTNNGFDWQDTGTTNQLASSTGPVDDEAMILAFAATPTITTPTGTYSVTSTYIATATF